MCQEGNIDSMKEHFQRDYLDRYECVQAKLHQVSQFEDSSAVSTTYVGRTERPRRDALN